MKKTSLIFCLIIALCTTLFAQQEPTWDNTSKKKWSDAFVEVSITSSVDGTQQKAFMYSSKNRTPQPLIVSLHTWSGNYTQTDPLTKEILARDWNYIHPDFRGANNHPEAMGSPLAISDIEDAIRYAVEQTNADPEEVHVIGVSGGGYATLLSYMNTIYPVRSFSAWVPISDIEAWYWESVGRGQKYAIDIIKSLSSDSVFYRDEAERRSPIQHTFPVDIRKNAKLYIYAGIHDGYRGSVPITHSLNMYNRLVGELKYNDATTDEISVKAFSDKDLVSKSEIVELLSKRINPDNNRNKTLYGRNIHLFREYENIQLTIFEGRHEQLPQALGLIPYEKQVDLKKNILILGDSNAANSDGWATQLQGMIPNSSFFNISKSGRTIGFDNNGKAALNMLRNIDSCLDEVHNQLVKGKIDYVIVNLGTNDTKVEFSERQQEILANFEQLLNKIKKHKLYKNSKLIFVTPPPIRATDVSKKYNGSNERLSELIPQLKSIAEKKKVKVVDVYQPLLGVLDYYALDGVHMSAKGQEIIALKILNGINQ
ncbi:SGNH/GDSL hydrolase family protein [Bacteroides sp. 214]|uniref:SGNH/GDSL hydrolase family protein n=1 Tax=Bacteroides sp. 214 TaxID=2302935 RepID=UPI0013CF9F16|nr:SGNH/GDSL hydrolase family protein [Bacteroides sp. 214]NDW11483.1 SGNH/GDSL hydrolase family protein [Bacteroides sp. 214]